MAISGVPPFAGFFSKDEILARAWTQSPVLFFFLAVTSVLTAIYMFILCIFLTFYGTFRGTHDQGAPPARIPTFDDYSALVVLAILSSTVGGFLGLPTVFSEHHFFGDFLEILSVDSGTMLQSEASHAFEWTLIGVSIITSP